ncbi:MAG: M61 family peptidase, partial [Acidobacteria bacterium]
MNTHNPTRIALLLSLIVSFVPSAALAAAGRDEPIRLSVDAREAPRKLLHAREEIPVAPGPLRLVYPKWIPGEHGPTGPVTNLAGLVMEAGGQTLAWRRDPLDPFAFEVTVPEGADTLTVRLDFLAIDGGQYSAGASTTPALAVVSWNQVLLYPEGPDPDALRVAPELVVPEEWKVATALRPVRREAGRVTFAPVPLTTLVDSPVLAARYMREELLVGEPV